MKRARSCALYGGLLAASFVLGLLLGDWKSFGFEVKASTASFAAGVVQLDKLTLEGGLFERMNGVGVLAGPVPETPPESLDDLVNTLVAVRVADKDFRDRRNHTFTGDDDFENEPDVPPSQNNEDYGYLFLVLVEHAGLFHRHGYDTFVAYVPTAYDAGDEELEFFESFEDLFAQTDMRK